MPLCNKADLCISCGERIRFRTWDHPMLGTLIFRTPHSCTIGFDFEVIQREPSADVIVLGVSKYLEGSDETVQQS